MTKAQEMLELARGLRARRIICDGGNGNVYDIADEECERAAEIIERLAAQADAPGGQPQSPADVTDAHKHVMQAIKELHEASIPVPMSLHHAAHALHYADTRPDRKSEA
jgi:hypothetical protein